MGLRRINKCNGQGVNIKGRGHIQKGKKAIKLKSIKLTSIYK